MKDSVKIESKLTVDQDVKIKGQTVLVGDSKAKANFKVLGTTQMKGNAFVEGVFKFKGLADSSLSDDRFLLIRPNGKVVSMEKSGISQSVISTAYSSPCQYLTDLNGNAYLNPSPTWASTPGVNQPGVLWTGGNCAPTRVGRYWNLDTTIYIRCKWYNACVKHIKSGK